MTTQELATRVNTGRAAVLRAIKDGRIPARAVRWKTNRSGRRTVEIIDPDLAMRSWVPRAQFRVPATCSPARPETEYERDSADVERELGALGHNDRAAHIAEANKQLAHDRAVLAAITKAEKAGRLDDELAKHGVWVRMARRSLVWAKVIARRRTLSALDVNHLEGFVDEALYMLLGDPEPEDSTPEELS